MSQVLWKKDKIFNFLFFYVKFSLFFPILETFFIFFVFWKFDFSNVSSMGKNDNFFIIFQIFNNILKRFMNIWDEFEQRNSMYWNPVLIMVKYGRTRKISTMFQKVLFRNVNHFTWTDILISVEVRASNVLWMLFSTKNRLILGFPKMAFRTP